MSAVDHQHRANETGNILEESKDLQSFDDAVEQQSNHNDVRTHDEAVTTEHQFSHLFPAHLYVKKRTAGQEIDHSEDVGGGGVTVQSESQQLIETEAKVLPLLFDNESKVQIGPEATASSYDRVPVDAFGTAVLTKLGWQGSGHGIGRNKDKAAQVIEYIPRQHRLGLGAQALTKEQLLKQAEGSGAQLDKRKLIVTQTFQGSSIGKNFKGIDEELVDKNKEVLEVGSNVVICGGTHKGLSGKVVAIQRQKAAPREAAFGMSSSTVQQALQGADKIDPDAYVSVELSTSQSTVQVKRKRLDLSDGRSSMPGPAEETKRRHRSRSNSPSNNKQHKSSIRDDEDIGVGHRDHHHHSRHHDKDRDKKSSGSSKPLKWIQEGIQVRVTSKKAFKGRLYNRVVPVTTVLDHATFEVYSQEHNRPITELRERDVETVLPRSKDVEKGQGQLTVMVVRGRHKGATGTVNQLDKKRDKVQVLVDFTEMITVGQDDCSLKVSSND